MNKIFVYGMAKSSIKLNTSGPRRNLELDVLRLLFYLEKHRLQNEEAYAYILVYDNEKENLIYKWLDKYGFIDEKRFKIKLFKNRITEVNELEIKNEKENNKNFTNSTAQISQDITEKILKNIIDKDFEKYNLSNDQPKQSISWDYFKIFDNLK